MELNVVSFNILCVDNPVGGSIAERAPRVKAVLTPLNADLIGFQEATPVWLEIFLRDYGEDYEIYNVYRGENSTESTPILWKREKFQCLDKGTAWFSDTPEVESMGWDELYNCPRIFSWARLREKATGREFCFANTHFGFGDSCQRKSVGILREFARKMGCPCVITGDFNMEMDSVGYGAMAQAFVDVNAATVNDTGYTFHGFDPAQYGEHIDYIFVTRDIRQVSFRCIRETVDGGFPSDHYCLTATLIL